MTAPPQLMSPEEGARVMNDVHRTFHRGGANKSIPWCNPMNLTFKPTCPCLRVCDDCREGRCKRNPKACVEEWNPGMAGWRRMSSWETQLLHPIAPDKRPVTRSWVRVIGCCGRFVCRCSCRRTTTPTLPEPHRPPVQDSLFEGLE